jgi:predicted DNA-binding transcriptional regulator YafY
LEGVIVTEGVTLCLTQIELFSKFKSKDAKLLEDYIEKETNEEKKQELILLQDKIKGVYIGSKQEAKELNLKDENHKKFNILTRAIKEKRKVKILYYSYGKGENERVIDRAEMFLFQDGWYVAAFCEYKQDIRHFELKRIIKYELLNEKYE